MLELLHQVPLFSWLPEEGAETLSNCFDLCVEELNGGETRATEGRIGCLLHNGSYIIVGTSLRQHYSQKDAYRLHTVGCNIIA